MKTRNYKTNCLRDLVHVYSTCMYFFAYNVYIIFSYCKYVFNIKTFLFLVSILRKKLDLLYIYNMRYRVTSVANVHIFLFLWSYIGRIQQGGEKFLGIGVMFSYFFYILPLTTSIIPNSF